MATSSSKSNWFSRWISRRRNEAKIGFFGETNAGKTTLANPFSLDYTGKKMGSVSEIPHETRTIEKLEQVNFHIDDTSLELTLMDMPGIASSVDFQEFIRMGIPREDALVRAREATRGIIEAIRSITEVDLGLIVVDLSKAPFDQVNLTILGNLEANKVPCIIVGNKMDLPGAKENSELLDQIFPDMSIILISALDGKGVKDLYSKIAEVV
ncbi:MAG: 50S ribosome-binding GTPase [Candidatus Heimdallarchaeota archaeon]|nr:50S ribosome-binding GTPase [Candidatus Heimdallarchaeota archaeon]MCK5049737.1 50S ribosome-binding GTPase [Candidatus Heimdallarchaeota archaeon]